MKILKVVFNFYLNSSIHVALSVCMLTMLTMLQLDLSFDKNVLYFVFFASITGYNFVKYFGLAKFHHRRLANWLKVIQVFSGIAFLFLTYFLFKLETNAVLLILGLALITFLYAIPLFPKHLIFDEQQNLRQIGGLKVYIIALVWTLVTVLIPIVNAKNDIDSDVFINLFQRFLLVVVLMLPFEIRDLNYDSLKLATIPQKIGVKKTKVLGTLVLNIFFFLEFFKDELKVSFVLVNLTLTISLFLFLLFSSKNQSKYYSSFWVEALPICWVLLYLCFVSSFSNSL